MSTSNLDIEDVGKFWRHEVFELYLSRYPDNSFMQTQVN